MTDYAVMILLGDRHGRQYQTDAHFRATIDQLARLLPLWVDGIANACAEGAREREQMFAALAGETT